MAVGFFSIYSTHFDQIFLGNYAFLEPAVDRTTYFQNIWMCSTTHQNHHVQQSNKCV